VARLWATHRPGRFCGPADRRAPQVEHIESQIGRFCHIELTSDPDTPWHCQKVGRSASAAPLGKNASRPFVRSTAPPTLPRSRPGTSRSATVDPPRISESSRDCQNLRVTGRKVSETATAGCSPTVSVTQHSLTIRRACQWLIALRCVHLVTNSHDVAAGDPLVREKREE
jgi:hypothetical protein